MTEKQYRKSVEKILIDLHAAKAFLNRVEANVRTLIGTSSQDCAETASEAAQDAFYGVTKENTHVDPSNATEGRFRLSDAISPVLTQDDLFAATRKLAKNETNNAVSLKKSQIHLSRKEVMDNFRRIASKKDLLDLADVNQILGFHRSTSGSFVKLAVRRGDLGSIPVGKETKFLPIDVRGFISSYFANQRKG